MCFYTQIKKKIGIVAAEELHRMRILDKMPLPNPVDVWRLGKLHGKSYEENDIAVMAGKRSCAGT